MNLLTVFFEMLTIRHLTMGRLRRALHVENIGLLQGIGAEGALLLSGHVGNWELLAFGAAAISGVPFSVIVTEQNDYGELAKMRSARGNRLIPTGRGAREASALLREGGVVALLADQSASERDHLVEIFSIPTFFFSSPARLALRFRPCVIVGFAVREADGNYCARLEEIEHGDLEDNPEGVETFMKRYVALLERVVRERPEQWVWHHRRWKHSPSVDYDSAGRKG